MKSLILHDIHGRPKWKQLKDNQYAQKGCVGDLFDSRYISGKDQLINARKLLKWLDWCLIGNHDIPYLYPNHKCPGYNPAIAQQAKELLEEFKHKLFIAKIVDGYLVTHAGVSKTWLKRNETQVVDLTIEDQLNELYKYTPDVYKFTPGRKFSNSGNEVTQTPLWIRPESLLKNMGYPKQIVGHTQVDKPERLTNIKNEELILIDSPDYYTVINDGVVSFNKFI